MHRNRLSSDDSIVLEVMVRDYAAGPPIYHPSQFWKEINEKNTRWLQEDGIENFKRSINNNYFNWMVWTKSDYFLTLFRHYLKSVARNPFRLKLLFSGRMKEMRCRTLQYEDHRPGLLTRQVYRVYLLLLYEYVRQTDPFGFFERFEEPRTGNPIVCQYRNKNISQDICNSYLEYAYIAQSLGPDFERVASIAEIGAGYGRLMYLFHALHPDKKLIIVDIPPALFVAQWYLEKVFPQSKLMKYRRFATFSEVEAAFEESDICFFLPHQMELLPDKSVDLLINISSLHEMKLAQVHRYYDVIDRKARRFYTKQWLFWENPSDGQAMPAVIYPTRPHWTLIASRLNPVHRKFFEALFELAPRESDP